MLALLDLPLDVTIPVDDCDLRATLTVPAHPRGLVIVVHPALFADHRPLTKALQARGYATLRLDLTGHDRHAAPHVGRALLDVDQQVARLVAVTTWAGQQPALRGLPVGYLGVGDRAGAAVSAAASLPTVVDAIATFGERYHVVHPLLPWVRTPTLLVTDDVAHERGPGWRVAMRHRVVAVPGRINDGAVLARAAHLASEWIATNLRDVPSTTVAAPRRTAAR